MHNIYIYIYRGILLSLFIISNLGFWEFFRSKTKVNSAFFPGLTVALQVSVLFFAGLLNILPEATYTLYAFGIIYCVYSFIKRKGKDFFSFYLKPCYIFLALASAYAIVYLQGKSFVSYDDFSHWGLVVKQMLSKNRFPNFEDTVIFFQEYPLGSSVYIYYVAKLIDSAEGLQMFAQTYMLLCAIMPCFIVCEKRPVTAFVLITLFTTFILTYNVSITCLLVDTLLPLIGAVALFFAVFHLLQFRKNLADSSDYQSILWLISLYLVQLVQIKNSGLFFALTVSIATLYLIKPHIRKLSFSSLASLAFPYVTCFLWHKHCKYLFSSAAKSKHALTITNFENVLAGKTSDDILAICKSMLKFSITNSNAVKAGITVLIVCIVALLLSRISGTLSAQKRKSIILCGVFCVLIYALYQFGMLLMYIFSMPLYEASILASSGRYCRTILVFDYYILLLLLLSSMSELGKSKKHFIVNIACAVLFSFAVILGNKSSLSSLLSFNSSSSDFRHWIEKSSAIYQVIPGSSYCFLLQSEDYSYDGYLGRYLFQSPYTVKRVVDENTDMSDLENYKYIFNHDKDNPIIAEWITENYPEQIGNDVIITH